MKTIRIAIFVLVALMLSASAVYFAAAYEESNEEGSNEENEIRGLTDNDEDEISVEHDEETELPEAAFFSLVGLAYIPVSGWMIHKKHESKKPYVVALIGSLAMIVFYVLTRTIDLPIIGLQTDVGITDTAAKILQVAAVGFSGFLIYKIEKLSKK